MNEPRFASKKAIEPLLRAAEKTTESAREARWHDNASLADAMDILANKVTVEALQQIGIKVPVGWLWPWEGWTD